MSNANFGSFESNLLLVSVYTEIPGNQRRLSKNGGQEETIKVKVDDIFSEET